MIVLRIGTLVVCLGSLLHAQAAKPTRCELVPLPGDQVSFRLDGEEVVRWHFHDDYPRPFFFPFNGPSGATLTRMGHPGAPNHDHHRSVWFAHSDVEGVDSWSDTTKATIRQKSWYCYRDGEEECVMACLMGWYDGDGKELLEQDTVAAIIPLDNHEYGLELQITLRPPDEKNSVTLGKTNFGFLAVRVAKTVSAYFGDGKISSSEGARGEAAIFGKPARWMDYSGSVAVGEGKSRKIVIEGVTYFDHPSNPRYPTSWHVREDGWMGASFCMHESFELTADAPLTLRYLLHAHRGEYHREDAKAIHEAFEARPPFRISKARKRHFQYEVVRVKN